MRPSKWIRSLKSSGLSRLRLQKLRPNTIRKHKNDFVEENSKFRIACEETTTLRHQDTLGTDQRAIVPLSVLVDGRLHRALEFAARGYNCASLGELIIALL